MPEPNDRESQRKDTHPDLDQRIGRKADRRINARTQRRQAIWFGLGMFGLVGWSVAIPTLIGAATGVWLDRRFPNSTSWTLTLLIGGVLIGCLNAWRWLRNESERPHE